MAYGNARWGHGRHDLAEIAHTQMGILEFYSYFWVFSNQPAIELTACLTALAPKGMGAIFYTSGRSEEIEN